MRDSAEDAAPRRIEDYALISSTSAAALVHRDGTIDWLCLPRFDSAACFASLLGERARHGSWTLAAIGERRRARRYLGPTMIVETLIEAEGGSVRVLDFMPLGDETPAVIRVVAGQAGRARLRMRLAPRFGYGRERPAIALEALGARFTGQDARLRLTTSVPLVVADDAIVAEWTVDAGSLHAFVLADGSAPASPLDATAALADCERGWRDWAAMCSHPGQPRALVQRSLLTLKALMFAPTGGMVAAPTTSLPERRHGARNWDYRFCWLRDATLTLMALLAAGHHDEARAWRARWLLRTVGDAPDRLQPVYGVAGERAIRERTLDHLPGFGGARPVRIGNAAAGQFQLDVFGELLDCLHQARRHALVASEDAWALQRACLDIVAARWREPDRGLWETRGAPRHFVHSKVMAWVAADRAVCAAEQYGFAGPIDDWRALRRRIHADVCAHGFDGERGAFVQAYGERRLDAAVLMIPLVGFLPADDPRVTSTVATLERELVRDGFLWRYDDHGDEGDGAFLACSFWLADYYTLAGREREARAWFERASSAANDLGLLSETYDPRERRQWGNFPQAFSHLALVTTAANLTGAGAAHRRRGC